MCKKIKDILFPTNLLGRKVVCKSAVVSAPTRWPAQTITHTVIWSGDRLQIDYTCTTAATIRPGRGMYDIDRYEMIREAGDMSTETFDITTYSKGHGGATRALVENTIYFKCTNVTYLSIDGEQLI